MFYVLIVKIVPDNIYDLLTAKGLAFSCFSCFPSFHHLFEKKKKEIRKRSDEKDQNWMTEVAMAWTTYKCLCFF